MMLKPAAFFLLTSIVAFTNTTVVFAAAPPLHPDKCPKGSSTGVPPASVTISPDTPPAEVEKLLNKIVSCPSACYDLTVSLGVNILTLSLDVKTTALDQCRPINREKPEEDNRGCAEGDNQPRVTVKIEEKKGPFNVVLIKGQTIGPKSRCDTQLSNIVNSAIAKFSNKDTKGLAADLEELAALPPAPEIRPLSDSENYVLGNAFRDSLPESAVQDIEKSNAAAEIERLTNAGNISGAVKVAEEAKLNPSTIDAIRKLTPPVGDRSIVQEVPGRSGPVTPAVVGFQSTNTGAVAAQCGIAGYVGNFAYAESACGRKPVSTTGCLGLYHYCSGTWRADTQATGYGAYADPRYRNDPEISTKVLSARLEQYRTRYGAEWAQVGIPEHVGLYACHVMGEGGCRAFTQAYSTNPNQSASVLRSALGRCGNRYCYDINRSIYDGKTLAGVASDLDRRLGGSGAPIISNIATGSLSPFGNFTSDNTPRTAAAAGSSPLSSLLPDKLTSLFTGNQGGQSAPVSATQSGIPTLSIPDRQYSGSGSVAPAETLRRTLLQPQTPVATATSSTQAIAAIIAQPSEVLKGRTIVVSWSSVGTKPSAPCQVILERESTETVIGQGNEGTKTIKTDTTMQSGTWNFTLRCTALSNDSSVEDATSVEVQ